MPKTSRLGSGILMNWVAFAISCLVTFFLSPFVVHRLGNIAYGIWVLVNSSIAYMGLLDLGLRGAVIRFVAKYQAEGNHLESSRVISAALWLRILISLLIATVSLVLAGWVNEIFRIPADLQIAARWAILVTGVSFAVTLTCGIFGGVLAALHRFDLMSGVAVFQTLLNGAGIVWLLNTGHGIVALAIWQLFGTVAANIALTALCFRVYRELRIFFQLPHKNILQDLGGYSFYMFLLSITGQIIWYTDNLVVGAFLSAAAVTFYSIGGRLLEYLRQPAALLAQTFMPLASNLEAQGQQNQLRRLLIQGTRAALFVSWPIEVVLFFRGPTFIGLWMGQQYAAVSGEVLRILLLAAFIQAGNHASGNIIFGLGKHRPAAFWQAAEAVANFALSIFLVRRIGLYGVAWGTVLPDLVVQLLLWPRYICKIVDVPVWSYFWQAWIRPGLAMAPFCIACVYADRHWIATNLLQFFLQTAALLPLFLLGVALCFWKEVNWQLRSEGSLLRRRFLGKLRCDPLH